MRDSRSPAGIAHAQLRICLYVAGDGPNSTAALANLRRALEQHPGAQERVDIVDVLADPERALRDGILVTPMLVKSAPLPERRILGTLHDLAGLLGALGLEAPHE